MRDSPTFLPVRLDVLAEEAEEDAVDPPPVPPVRAAADALAHEAGSFRVPDPAFVEPVALDLEPVVGEVEKEVPLQEPRRPVRDAVAPERRMDSQAAEAGDPGAAIRLVEPENACEAPLAVHVDLDDEAASFARRLQ